MAIVRSDMSKLQLPAVVSENYPEYISNQPRAEKRRVQVALKRSYGGNLIRDLNEGEIKKLYMLMINDLATSRGWPISTFLQESPPASLANDALDFQEEYLLLHPDEVLNIFNPIFTKNYDLPEFYARYSKPLVFEAASKYSHYIGKGIGNHMAALTQSYSPEEEERKKKEVYLAFAWDTVVLTYYRFWFFNSSGSKAVAKADIYEFMEKYGLYECPKEKMESYLEVAMKAIKPTSFKKKSTYSEGIFSTVQVPIYDAGAEIKARRHQMAMACQYMFDDLKENRFRMWSAIDAIFPCADYLAYVGMNASKFDSLEDKIVIDWIMTVYSDVDMLKDAPEEVRSKYQFPAPPMTTK